MKKEILQIIKPDSDPFGLRGFDFNVRVPEKSEMFDEKEAKTYIDGCDYPKSIDDLLLALEMQKLFNPEGIRRMKILDAMCGPGRLGREFLDLGAQHLVFQDGDDVMITHAKTQAFKAMQSGQSVGFSTSGVDNILLPDNMFDLVICHNSTHQMANIDRLRTAMQEFLRITVPLGHVVIADYQRAITPEFLKALEERLQWTRPEIIPLLIPSFTAAFSKEEFNSVLGSIPGIKKWTVTNAEPPMLTPEMRKRVNEDPVKGHIMDYSSISLRVIVQKEKI